MVVAKQNPSIISLYNLFLFDELQQRQKCYNLFVLRFCFIHFVKTLLNLPYINIFFYRHEIYNNIYNNGNAHCIHT